MNSMIFLLRRDAITALWSRIRQPVIWAITLSILICSHLVVTNALASKHGKTDIDVVHPFSRALPPSSKNGAVYLQIINKVTSDRLLGASTPIAKLAEIHTHESDVGCRGNVEATRCRVHKRGDAKTVEQKQQYNSTKVSTSICGNIPRIKHSGTDKARNKVLCHVKYKR